MEKKAEGMVDGSQCRHFVGRTGDVVRTDIGHSGIESLGFQQCAQQEGDSLAVAVTLAQHFGRPVGPMSCQSVFKGDVAYVLLYVGIGAAYLLQFIGASGSNFIRQHFGLGESAVHLGQSVQPAVHGLYIGKGTGHQQMGIEAVVCGSSFFPSGGRHSF